MKALTVRQPWASLIIAGAKPYEFRGWRPPSAQIGQRLVIHAGARRVDRDEVEYLLSVLINRDMHRILAAETCLIPDLAIPVLQACLARGLPMSAGIGTVVVGEPRLGTDIAEDFGVPRSGSRHGAEGDISGAATSNWGWAMTEIDRWDQPLPMRGRQGLWNWPEPEGILA